MTSSQMKSRCDWVLSFQRSGVEVSAVDQNCARCPEIRERVFCVKPTSSSNWRLSRSVSNLRVEIGCGAQSESWPAMLIVERNQSIGRRIEQALSRQHRNPAARCRHH